MTCDRVESVKSACVCFLRPDNYFVAQGQGQIRSDEQKAHHSSRAAVNEDGVVDANLGMICPEVLDEVALPKSWRA